MKITGLNDFQKQLKQMQRGAKELSGSNQIPITDLFTDEFLRNYTKFQSFNDFENQKIFKKYPTIEEIPDEEMDSFVVDHSEFNSWQEMIESASSEFVIKKLGF